MGVLEEGQVVVAKEWQERVDRQLGETLDALADHEERFNRGNDRFTAQDREIAALRTDVQASREELAVNTEIGQRTEKAVKEILGIFGAFQGFVKVGGWLGTLVKWIAGVAIAFGILVYIWKTGQPPTPK